MIAILARKYKSVSTTLKMNQDYMEFLQREMTVRQLLKKEYSLAVKKMMIVLHGA